MLRLLRAEKTQAEVKSKEKVKIEPPPQKEEEEGIKDDDPSLIGRYMKDLGFSKFSPL